MAKAILAIDQGTTSSRCIVFSSSGEILGKDQCEFEQLFPAEDQVEHSPDAIWDSVVATAQQAYRAACDDGHEIIGIGITNQRETIVVWDRQTGRPIHNAIVWQDRRTATFCENLEAAGHADLIQEKTGLLIDPYFSASKLSWILDNVEGARAAAESGQLAAGTIDTFLLWRLTAGERHMTDATNACRTGLFNLEKQMWDEELLDLYRIPPALLPEIKDSADNFGTCTQDFVGKPLPIRSMIGDQQAASVGQACFSPGQIKATYGTGCFVLVNTGDTIKRSQHRLLSTVAYRLNGKPTFAVEGSIFIAGAAVQWLRDSLGVLQHAAETEERAARAEPDGDVIMVPAFTGMGAPHWSPGARAAVFGMTRGSGPDELAKAALEGVIYQTGDLLRAMQADGLDIQELSVDGGMVANDWFVQRLANIIDLQIRRPNVLETTALGAACLAFLQAGVFSSLDDIKIQLQTEGSFTPHMRMDERERLLRRWKACVDAVLLVAGST